MLNYNNITKNQIKNLSNLKLKKDRYEQGLFIAEGYKICHELFLNNSKHKEIELILFSDDANTLEMKLVENFKRAGCEVVSVNPQDLRKISYTENPQGISAVMKMNKSGLDYSNSFIALTEINDPGNLGTIIRSADWFNVKNIILTANSVDVYNPKVIRASMGAFFRENIIYTNDLEGLILKHYQDIPIFVADSNSDNSIYNLDVPKKFGIVFGSESHGIDKKLSKNNFTSYKIDGNSESDSLNVAISMSISLFYFTMKHKNSI